MVTRYPDLLADAIAKRMCEFFRGHRNELQQRVKDMIQAHRGKNDPHIVVLADDVLRVSAFLEHAVYMASMLCCRIQHDYLYPNMDVGAAYDTASAQVEVLWEMNWCGWMRGFRSSIVKRMIEDRKGMRNVAKDILRLIFTPEELVAIETIAKARDGALAMLRFAEFLQVFHFGQN